MMSNALNYFKSWEDDVEKSLMLVASTKSNDTGDPNRYQLSTTWNYSHQQKYAQWEK